MCKTMPTRTKRLILALFCYSLLIAVPTRADVTNLTLSPSNVFGTDTSTGTVTTTPPSPPLFIRSVALTSSNPAVASVPESVFILGIGDTTANFTITTSPVNVQTNVAITASEGGVSFQRTLTVRPPQLTSITFSPDPLRGSDSSTATITINRPAPANWLCSIQAPYPPIYFMTGSIVTFAPGATSTTKTVNSVSVPQAVDALITVNPPTGQSPSVSQTLMVVPTRAELLEITPGSISAGLATLGCVTLNGDALAGGAQVQLSSSDTSVARVPSTVQISQGDDDGCFVVQAQDVTECVSATIYATLGGQTVQADVGVGLAERLTDNQLNDRWGRRHSSTVDGQVLWTDGDDVWFDNGVGRQLVQPLGTLETVEDTVFGLGTGASAHEVIGAWRRGTDFAWVWSSGQVPILVNAVNPIDPQQPMNPEAIAIADGYVYMVFQAFSNGSAVKHVFEVDPGTGDATILSGSVAVPGAPRVTTDEGFAAWVFDDNSGSPKLHLYNGFALMTIDSGEISDTSVRLKRGRLVYEKLVGGVSHVLLYDSTAVSPMPVQITPDTDPAQGNFHPATDGYHVAWLFGDADRTNLDVILHGGLQLSDAGSRVFTPIVNNEFPLQLQSGQLLWRDEQADLRFFADGFLQTLCLTPADDFLVPWLGDGYIAGFGPTEDAPLSFNEIYLHPGTEPRDADLPMPPLQVTLSPGRASVYLEWDIVLGATSYNIYVAIEPGVTKDNYQSLDGGQRISGFTSSPVKVCDLSPDFNYHFVVTTVENGDEGSESSEVSGSAELFIPQIHHFMDFLLCLAGPQGDRDENVCDGRMFDQADFTCDFDVDLADFAKLSNLLQH